jgi:hypothetical protein
MLKRQNKRILNVLGFLTLAILVSGCSLLSSQPDRVEISTRPVEKPGLELPQADEIRLRDVDWQLITPENAEEIFETAEESGRPVVFFALTDKGYENLGLNISDIRAYIQQQKTIIAAYENYYEESQEALNGAVKTQDN